MGTAANTDCLVSHWRDQSIAQASAEVRAPSSSAGARRLASTYRAPAHHRDPVAPEGVGKQTPALSAR